MSNAPEASACFLLDEDIGEVKITYTADTKVANAGEEVQALVKYFV